jgi:hypothetical protein
MNMMQLKEYASCYCSLSSVYRQYHDEIRKRTEPVWRSIAKKRKANNKSNRKKETNEDTDKKHEQKMSTDTKICMEIQAIDTNEKKNEVDIEQIQNTFSMLTPSSNRVSSPSIQLSKEPSLSTFVVPVLSDMGQFSTYEIDLFTCSTRLLNEIISFEDNSMKTRKKVKQSSTMSPNATVKYISSNSSSRFEMSIDF